MDKEQAKQEINSNPILSEVQELLIKQTAKGLEKYGHSVRPDKITTIEWLTHLQEELLDGLIYVTIAKKQLIELEGEAVEQTQQTKNHHRDTQ